ncbi:hypothetical protein NHX12_001517 [Muraenolepis orangiensis]|uniref:Perilipin n=1 Tax=Muraenolepis orangiensis TaxID=630683 RepID=A0A9Q0IF17_9TELE|nr:hypothetical protein NHX12_001517 [Muraenolepis orangiensis]
MSFDNLSEGNVVLRVSRLPLVSSTLQTVTSVYSGVKGRYPLLGMVGAMAEVGVRSASLAALKRAAPLLQSLDTQIEVANDYACFGLDQLEKSFPVLHQSSSEVMGHLKDAFFLTLDDVQLRVLEGMDVALGGMEGLSERMWLQLQALQNSNMGRTVVLSLDELLTQLEDASAYYLPLPPTMRLWTRFRSLLLRLSLQLYHRMMKQRDALAQVLQTLEDGANKVGLGWLLDLMGFLIHQQQLFLMALLFQAEALRDLTVAQVKGQTAMLAELSAVRQLRGLPSQVQEVLVELQELAKILLQLLINSTPLYAMLQQPSNQDVEDYLNQESFTTEIAPRRESSNSLFLKAMDGRPRRRKSLYSRAQQGSGGTATPQGSPQAPPCAVNGGDPEPQEPPSETPYRRPSATELLLTPIVQLLSQGQKAFEYLSPTPNDDDEDTSSVDETAED